MSTQPSPFPMELNDLGTMEPVVFRDLEAMRAWIKGELDLWAWVPQYWQGKSAKGDVVPIGTQANLLSATEAWEKLANAILSGDADEVKLNASQVAGYLKAAYADPKAVIPGSPAHQVMKDASVYGTAAAMGAYCGMFDRKGRIPHNQAVEFTIGWTRGFLFNGGLGDAPQKAMERAEFATAETLRFTQDARTEIEAKRKDSEENHKTIAGLAQDAKVKVGVALNDMERVKADAGELSTLLTQRIDAALRNATTRVDAHIGESEEKLKSAIDGIVKANQVEISLRAPVTYWKSQRTTCFVRAGIGFAAVLIAGLCMACYGVGLFDEAIKLAKDATASAISTAGMGTSSSSTPPAPVVDYSHWWQIGRILFLTTLGLWLLRLLVRFTLSQTHMALDAGFRVVMTTAYIAMIQEKHIDGKEARELVLKSLFRPPSTGMIRDDALPPTPGGVIAENVTR